MKQLDSAATASVEPESDLIPFPYEIRFDDSASSPATRDLIESHLSALPGIYQRITRAQVAVRIPHKHGGLRFFHIHIQLDVPGKKLIVSREPEANEAHTDIRLAVKDAFGKLEHQLEVFAKLKKNRYKF
ncbi:MAG TPA: HPF/RaiA family ribosome-associated protein [Bdellovibrionales bacterium]|nr:HPF/RaiA family ribosome-associated protein [Bdellovibrionales bacterium]